MPRIACKNCGMEITGAGAVLFCSCGTKSDAKSIDPAWGLPGTELKRIIPGYLGKRNCETCRDYAAMMDAWGVDGCERRLDRIVNRLVSVASEYRIAKLFPNTTRDTCRGWVRKAIDNAQAAEQTAIIDRKSIVWVYWAGGADGDELRYSIRSACQNISDWSNIVVCGDHPGPWYKGDFIRSPRFTAKAARRQFGTDKWQKWIDSTIKLRRIVASELVTDRFLWLYDDSFITRPCSIEDIAAPRARRRLHAGDLEKPVRRKWRDCRRRTALALHRRGLPTRDFSTHYPMVYDKPKLTATLDRFGCDTAARCIESLYGNEHLGKPANIAGAFQYSKSISNAWSVRDSVSVVNVGGFGPKVSAVISKRFPDASPVESRPICRQSDKPKISVICAVSITDHWRRRNWQAWLEQISGLSQSHEIETIVVNAGDVDDTPGFRSVVTDTAFSKTRWLNLAASEATAPVLCFADLDFHLPPETWALAITEASTVDFYSPYDKVRWLHRNPSNYAIASGRYTAELKGDVKDGNLCGGIMFCRRDAFDTVGRWDERFTSWGYEDDALEVLARRSHECKTGTLIATHLWHPGLARAAGREASATLFATGVTDRSTVF